MPKLTFPESVEFPAILKPCPQVISPPILALFVAVKLPEVDKLPAVL